MHIAKFPQHNCSYVRDAIEPETPTRVAARSSAVLISGYVRHREDPGSIVDCRRKSDQCTKY
jgi:hypothetical protein